MSLLNALLRPFTQSATIQGLKKWQQGAQRIGALEEGLRALSDEELKQKARALKVAVRARYEGELSGDLKKFSREYPFHPQLIETFAIGREASRRLLGMRHFDEQLIGGLALHEAKLAEMRTGEGKTLVITLPALYNALAGVPTYVVTVNDYLAKRDSELMSPLYEFFDLTVGLLRESQTPEDKKKAYESSIVYGVNHEFGFDYLRDNMVLSSDERKMRGLGFAIVDEVDSILIDEARTPLIISGTDNDDLSLYTVMQPAINALQEKTDVEIDRKLRNIALTEKGFEKLEEKLLALGIIEHSHHLYEPSSSHVMRAAQAMLQARFLFIKDKQYIVRDNKVLIVDEMTGRLMEDRRWSNGFHQAVEAKEGVEILQENKTLATITYQNFFRLFPKLAGLTGTAMTQASEFAEIYGLTCVQIPTHRPMIRQDQSDVMFRTAREKWKAIADEIQRAQKKNQPVLAGTASIEDSETLSQVLTERGIHHETLNAKNHTLEAAIIEQAGAPGKVTVATNMAGRGTDILLGGNLEARIRAAEETGYGDEETKKALEFAWQRDRETVLAAGGLYVIGSCRNESRRVDNQLRGRSGRQGDPGESRFIVSLEDEMFRVFAQNGVLQMIDRFNMMPEGVALEHGMLNRSLEKAQTGVENHHYNMRKQLIEYDDVAAKQRTIVYGWRNDLMDATDIDSWSENLIEQAVQNKIDLEVTDEHLPEQWDVNALKEEIKELTGLELDLASWIDQVENAAQMSEKIHTEVFKKWNEVRGTLNDNATLLQRHTILRTIDDYWQDHITHLQHLLEGIHLRSYAQKNPKQEYTRDAYEMFGRMTSGIANSVASGLLALKPFQEGQLDEQVLELTAQDLRELQGSIWGEQFNPDYPASKNDWVGKTKDGQWVVAQWEPVKEASVVIEKSVESESPSNAVEVESEKVS